MTVKLRLRAAKKVGASKTKSTNGKVIQFPKVARKASDAVDKIVIDTAKVTKANATSMIRSIMDESGRNDVRIGGVLAVVKNGNWYDEPTFGEYVYKRFGFTLRKAQYLILSYETIERLGLRERDIRGIGWSKFRLIAPLLDDKNKGRWLKKARKATMATLESITKKARRAKAGADGSVDPAEKHEDVTTVKFQLHKDQSRNVHRALTEAQRVCGTKHQTVALDYICTAFLASVDKAPKPIRLRDLVARLVTETSEAEALKYVRQELRRLFPGVGISFGARVEKAVTKAAKTSKAKSKPVKKAKTKSKPVKKAKAAPVEEVATSETPETSDAA